MDFLFFTLQSFFKKFEKAAILLFKQMEFSEIKTTIHKGILTENGESLFMQEHHGFNDHIKSISVHGGFSKATVLTFCVYDKAFKHFGESIIDGKTQWRFEVTVHPRHMKAYIHQFQPTTAFFDVIEQFSTLLREQDKWHQNHGVNVLLKTIKIALQEEHLS